MVKVIRDSKTGRFAGSVGVGKNKVPTPVKVPSKVTRMGRIENMLAKRSLYNPNTPWIDPESEPITLRASNSWRQQTFFQALEARNIIPFRSYLRYLRIRNTSSENKLLDIALDTLKKVNNDYDLRRDTMVTSGYLWGILHNKNVTGAALNVLGSSHDPYVRILVAMHDKTSRKVFNSLLVDQPYDFSEMEIGSLRAAAESTKHFADHKRPARKNPRARWPVFGRTGFKMTQGSSHSLSHWNRKGVVDPAVAKQAARWGNLSDEAQNLLSRSSSAEALEALIKNPHVDEKYQVIAALNSQGLTS